MAYLRLSGPWTALLRGLIAGVGAGIVSTVIADVALSVLSKEQSGLASGTNDTYRDLGIAVGIAGLAPSSPPAPATRLTLCSRLAANPVSS
jgi:hypothetical protein